MEVDGIGNSEVYCGLERHGLHEREGGVPELELRIEQALLRAVVGAELHDTLILLLSLFGMGGQSGLHYLFI